MREEKKAPAATLSSHAAVEAIVSPGAVTRMGLWSDRLGSDGRTSTAEPTILALLLPAGRSGTFWLDLFIVGLSMTVVTPLAVISHKQ